MDSFRGSSAPQRSSVHESGSGPIIYLGGSEHSGYSLEDLVTKKVYLEAVNRELEIWHEGLRYPEGKLPDTGRAKAVERWALRHKDADGEPIELRKVAIAQRILDQRLTEVQLVRSDKRDVLRMLDVAATETLSKATKDLGASPRSGASVAR